MKIYTWLQKVILAVMMCIFLIIAGGSLRRLVCQMVVIHPFFLFWA